LDEEGFLYVEGQMDDTIIRGAENIAPAEIEDVLLRHPDVLDAVVVGFRTRCGASGSRPWSWPGPGAASTWRELRAACRVTLRSSLTRKSVHRFGEEVVGPGRRGGRQ
jgi:acyl-CoA synthetase (AMP-forming)/AMP-acid ligase II